MNLREAAQQALEALEWHLEKGAWGADIEGVTAALRERLAQPEQEPVAWYFEARHIDSAWAAAVTLKHPGPEGKYMRKVTPLYTAPPRCPNCASLEEQNTELDAILARLADTEPDAIFQPLTEEQIKACEQQAMVNGALPFEQRVFFARAIERAHGIGTEARATLTKPCGSLGEEL